MSITRMLPVVLCGLGWMILGGCGDDDNYQVNTNNGDPCICPADEVINCGHRGTGTNGSDNPYPENTIPSFQRAVEEGAQMVELDVLHAADGALVVIHDETVNRTTDGTGCVGDQTTAELQQLDAAFGTDLEGEGVVIPTLEEVLAAVDVAINIEIKLADNAACPAPDIGQLAADVVDAIHGDAADRELVVSSFDFDVLVAVQDLDPAIYVGFITMLWPDAQAAADQGFAALNVFGATYGQTEIQSILDTGLEANVWTINEPDKLLELLGTGVSVIITDDPDVLEQARLDYCNDYCVVD